MGWRLVEVVIRGARIGGEGRLEDGMIDTTWVWEHGSTSLSLYGKQEGVETGKDTNGGAEAGDTILWESKKSEKVI